MTSSSTQNVRHIISRSQSGDLRYMRFLNSSGSCVTRSSTELGCCSRKLRKKPARGTLATIPSYSALAVTCPTNFSSRRWLPCAMPDCGLGYRWSSAVELKSPNAGSSTCFRQLVRNSLKTPPASIPASGRPWAFWNWTWSFAFRRASPPSGSPLKAWKPSSTRYCRRMVTSHFLFCTWCVLRSASTFARNNFTRTSKGTLWGRLATTFPKPPPPSSRATRAAGSCTSTFLMCRSHSGVPWISQCPSGTKGRRVSRSRSWVTVKQARSRS
mmetsp:Transcript_127744/g.220831  ORF Transcript_127744/g.220831 Transcript_127744/m.220831 type:complete len:270 (+) Transcript_127744:2907-3716(+)